MGLMARRSGSFFLKTADVKVAHVREYLLHSTSVCMKYSRDPQVLDSQDLPPRTRRKFRPPECRSGHP
jgi:hypothetical protein